jgi:hypothetical protein
VSLVKTTVSGEKLSGRPGSDGAIAAPGKHGVGVAAVDEKRVLESPGEQPRGRLEVAARGQLFPDQVAVAPLDHDRPGGAADPSPDESRGPDR